MIALSDMNLYLKAKKYEELDEEKYSKKIRAYTEKIMSDLFEIVDGIIASWNLEEVDLEPLKEILRQINEMVD